MLDNNSLSVSLSQEELFVAMLYLNAKELSGWNNESFDNLDEQTRNMVVGVAEKSLLARGFLEIRSDNHLSLRPIIFALVGACAFPESSFLVFQNSPNELQQEYYFHISRKMIVMHHTPMTEIHQFILLKEKADIYSILQAILNLPESSSQENVDGLIEQGILIESRDAAKKYGVDAAARILAHASLEASASAKLAKTLAAPFTSTTIAFVNNKPREDGFTVLQTDEFVWLLSPTENDVREESKFVHLSGVSSVHVLQYVKSLIEQI